MKQECCCQMLGTMFFSHLKLKTGYMDFSIPVVSLIWFDHTQDVVFTHTHRNLDNIINYISLATVMFIFLQHKLQRFLKPRKIRPQWLIMGWQLLNPNINLHIRIRSYARYWNQDLMFTCSN